MYAYRFIACIVRQLVSSPKVLKLRGLTQHIELMRFVHLLSNSMENYKSLFPLYLHTSLPLFLYTFIPLYVHTSMPLYLHTPILLYPITPLPLYLYSCTAVYLFTASFIVLSIASFVMLCGVEVRI